MKKIIRLTEDDLTRIVKRVIEEQPTPCPPRQVTKPIVDSILPVFKNELTTYINDMVETLTKKYSDEDSLSKEMSEVAISTINENFNLIYRIGVKNNYARFNIGGAYDRTSDIQSLVNNVINNGEKQLFKTTTKSGFSVITSKDHVFQTFNENGTQG